MKLFKKLFIIFLSVYLIITILLYFLQDYIIFNPKKLDTNYSFSFYEGFKELNIKMDDGANINSLLFKADSTKGLIFYLHGSGWSLNEWGNLAKTFTTLNYDFFIFDYRGFGKSSRQMINEEQFYSDASTIYNKMKEDYDEKRIIIIGHSIGTGAATYLSSINSPKKLILQAPFYSMQDLVLSKSILLPTFVLKYNFSINSMIKNCKTPITIFHGNKDRVVNYSLSKKLSKLLKKNDEFITLINHNHNGMYLNNDYLREIKRILK